MKKIILFLFITMFVLLISCFELKSQCEKCLFPNLCTQFTLSVPNCGNIKYTICYRCFSNSVHADIIEMEGITCTDEQGLDAVWDAGFQWIRDNMSELCGTMPCQIGSKTVIITRPMCATLVHLGSQPGTYKVKFDNSCDKRCTKEFEWCWCDCINIPNHCWNRDCIVLGPHIRFTYISSYVTGNGICRVDWSIGDIWSQEDWTIPCVLYDSHCQ